MATFRFTRRVQRRLALGLCLVACMAALSAAGAGNRIFASQTSNSATTAYSYYYFKEERPLNLDANRIAVLRAPDQRGSGAAMPDLSPYGLDVSAVEPMAVQRWSFIKTTAPAWTDIAVRDAVSQIAGREPVDFVSPVFLDDAGDPVVITPHILVGFDRGLDPARAEAILAATRLADAAASTQAGSGIAAQRV